MTIGNAKVEAIQGHSLNVQDNRDGRYTFNFTSCYDSKPLQVKINGTELKGSPFNVVPVDPQKCTIRLEPLDERSTLFIKLLGGNDREKKAIVQTVDCKGDKVNIGNAKVEAIQAGHSLNVQDNQDGTYTFNYTSRYDSKPLEVKINGTGLKGSPFNVVPEVDPKKCTIQLGLPGGNDRRKKAIVQTVDCNGDNMITGNAKVEAIQGHSLNVQDNRDGTYSFNYTSRFDSKPLQVKINGTEMKGSPFNVVPEVDPT